MLQIVSTPTGTASGVARPIYQRLEDTADSAKPASPFDVKDAVKIRPAPARIQVMRIGVHLRPWVWLGVFYICHGAGWAEPRPPGEKSDADVFQQIADQEKAGHLKAALDLVTKLVDSHPEQAKGWLVRSRLLLKSGNAEEAEEDACLAVGLTGGHDPLAKKLLDEARSSRAEKAAIAPPPR